MCYFNMGWISEEAISQFQEIIDNAKHIVFFWWAWVSTESWIPDFRSKDGLYNQHDIQFDAYQPEYLLSNACLYEEPEVFFEYYRQKLDCRNIKPNITHKKLAEWEMQWRDICIITQNIDGLHQKAWSKRVLEIHGTTQKVYCDKCWKQFNPDILYTSKERVPHCSCWGMLRPDVTLYWEQLPSNAWNESISALQNADLLILWGTSLAVYPANSLIHFFRGRHFVIINKDATPQDNYAELVFHNKLWEVFTKIS